MKRPANSQGFTLIEIMIVVVIIGILASIAYPSYTRYLARGYRAEARTLMFELAQQAEQRYSSSGSYELGRCPEGNPCKAGDRTERPFYEVSFAPDGHRYTVKATATENFEQGWKDDPCLELELSHTGERKVNGGSDLLAECWNR